MENLKTRFKEFAQKYCLKEILIILFFSLFMLFLYCGRTESFLVDVGREAIIPLRVLEGKVLYKDLFNVYGPLSYQINAIAYAIFGINLNTLYLMGFLNSLLIVFSVFYITKFFSNKKVALATAILVIVSCVYVKVLFNFIFPYSYGAVYALTGILFSACAGMRFIKDKKPLWLCLTFFFAGFSFANKIEYAPYFLFIFVWFFLFKENRTDFKRILIALASFFILPVLSFSTLFLQGMSFSDLSQAAQYVNNIVKTPALQFFYLNYGLYPSKSVLYFSFGILGRLLLYLVPFTLVMYALNAVKERFVESKILKTFFNIFITFLIFAFVYLAFSKYISIEVRFFVWLGIANLLILIGLGVNYLVKTVKSKCLPDISYRDKAYLFFLVTALLVSVKGILMVGSECYGTFSMTMLFIPLITFFTYYAPNIPKLNKNALNSVIMNIIFCTILLQFFGTLYHGMKSPLYPVKTERGTIFVKKYLIKSSGMIDYIKKNTPKDSVILSVPEGSIINFLSERKTHDKFYYLIPVNVQLFGETRIIEDLKKNPPDYFLLNTLPYDCFKTGYFCSYAPKICDFITENYEPEAMTEDAVKFYLYKRKH